MSYVDRTLEALREVALAAGGLRACCRAAGISKDTFHHWERIGSFNGAAVERWLAALDIDPDRFARYAFSSAGANVEPFLLRFGAEARTIAYDAKRGREPEMASCSRLAYLRGTLRALAGPTLDEEGRLVAIEALLDSDTTAAATGAQELVTRSSCLEVSCRAMRIWVEAMRSRRQHDRCQIVLWTAMRLSAAAPATSQGDFHAIQASLIRESLALMLARGAYDQGLEFGNALARQEEERGARDSAGRSYVFCAIMHYSRWDLGSAEQTYHLALSMLDSSSSTFRGAAYHGLATVSFYSDQLQQAEAYATKAERYVQQGTKLGFVLALRGSLADHRGNAAEALHFRNAAIQHLDTLSVEWLAVSADALRSMVRLGKSTAACRRTRAFLPLLDSVGDDPVLSVAIGDLVRAGLEGERALSARFVDEVISRIEHRLGWDAPSVN